ncbi:hypothetical protein PN462_03755 [Spirulina sp. CS-785/01]|uniref:hypothetical protein n=1 Tax=Spirulina sp. CS-785/01 TaxID=3021716 RepID=UPI00232D3CDE|nr:hypothetical protein [Spirulina sp. CS-785/01]MDB9312206.1 hypothetical protein [Spirulina sp. CS-785/01]
MNYLIAVLSNRTKAENAYNALAQEDLPMSQIDLLGEGYESADEFGLIHPNRQAYRRAVKLSYWLVPFGFAAGYAFNWLTGITIFDWMNAFGNHIFGGILGALSGLLGAVFAGGAVGWTVGSGDALAYRNRLNDGKYVLIAQGSDELLQTATRVLRAFEPENLQGYVEPTG